MAARIASKLAATSVGTPSASATPCAHDSPTKNLLPIALLLFAAIVPYLNSLPNSFHFDDFPEIVDNEGVRSLHGLWQARPLGRWLTYATYYANYSLHGLTSMPGWHLVNILLHVGCVLLLYQVMKSLCRHDVPHRVKADETIGTPAFCAALLFAVHPLATEPVNYLQARCVLLYSFLTLTALYCVVRVHRAHVLLERVLFATAAVIAVSLAALSKPVGLFFAIALPLLYLLVGWFPASPRKKPRLILAVASAFGASCLIGLWLVRANIWEGVIDRLHGELSHYFFSQTIIFWRYLGLAMLPLPSRLNVDHAVDYRPYNWTDGDVLVAMLAIFCVAVAAAKHTTRKHSAVSFLLVAIPVGLLPYFFLTSVEAMVEYRFYLPLAAFCGLIGLLASSLINRFPNRTVTISFVALVALLASATVTRNIAWRTDLTLWRDAVAKSPRKARTVNALAWAFLQDDVHGDAERGLELAKRSLDPRFVDLPPSFNPYMLDTLAEAYFRNGNASAAMQIENHLILQAVGDVAYFQRQLHRFSESSRTHAIDSSDSHR